MRDDHHRISPTAVLCAMGRAEYTDMPYAKEIYEKTPFIDKLRKSMILPNFIITPLLYYNPQVKNIISLLEGRYISTNKALEKFGRCSVLELAVGLSPRGLDIGNKFDVYIESDLAGIIKTKEKITRQIHENKELKIDNHYFLPINPLNYDELSKAGEIYKNNSHDSPLVIIHEGLFMYFNEKEQTIMRDNVARLLKEYSPNGAWITPDITTKKLDEKTLKKIIRRIKRFTNSHSGRYFSDDDEIKSFLEEGGLKREYLIEEDLLHKLSCIKKLGLNKEEVNDLIQNYRISVITLK